MNGEDIMPERGLLAVCELSKEEKQLILFIRRLKEGELIISVARGLPVKVDEIKRNIEL